MTDALQYKWNPRNADLDLVATKANERGPREKQAGLLDWAAEQERQDAWTSDGSQLLTSTDNPTKLEQDTTEGAST